MIKRVLILSFFCLWGKVALAGLSITPYAVVLDAESSKRSELVRILNTSDKTTTYRIKLINYRQNPDGSYTKITAPLSCCPFAEPYLNYSPRETTLEPNEAQTIRIQRKGMATAPVGEYVSHLWIQEMPPKEKKEGRKKENSAEMSVHITALQGITIPIIIDKGNLTSSAKILSGKIIRKDNRTYAQITLERVGNKSFFGDIIIREKEEEIGRINEFRIYLSAPQRVLLVPLTKQPEGRVQVLLKRVGTNEILSQKTI